MKETFTEILVKTGILIVDALTFRSHPNRRVRALATEKRASWVWITAWTERWVVTRIFIPGPRA